MKVLLVLSFAVLNIASDNSAEEDVINMCSNSSSYESYTKNITQNCGCEKNRPCIRKCCQKGFYLQHYEDAFENVFESVCIKKESHSFNLPIYTRRENIYNLTLEDNFMIGMLNCENDDWQYFKMNNSDIRERVYIQENGSLYYPASRYKIYDSSRYCVDEEDGLTIILCYTSTQPSVCALRIVNSVGRIISIPFLLISFLVFAIIPESSLHKKALMSYVLTLFLAYTFLLIVQLYPEKFDENFVCPALGYFIIFFFLSSFCWMNAMCLDMWFAFRDMRDITGRKLTERKRFLMYFAYAVVVPFLHILVVFLINKFGEKGSVYFPGIGYGKCFVGDGLPDLLYFYGPMAILIIVNVTLFILTAVKIQRIKKETSMLKQSDSKRHSYEDDKKKFNLHVKLLFAMGITWTVDIIAWAIKWPGGCESDWCLLHFCNAIYGIFIFFIFVFKKKILQSLKKRYYELIGKNPKQLGPVTTPPRKLASATTVQVNSTTEDERKECCIKIKLCFT
ncbi:G-protein coupled receptor Mth2-like [Anoplophora glabripennis]|uniref:G-protein coupled receptor Mth2-like n=1 Tax=Anoplophora glabripennis TaxID=217634 RepID=UPI000873AAD2|nr:G-protein coupled receptor Mth2-like [Anoplophora glabripennis]